MKNSKVYSFFLLVFFFAVYTVTAQKVYDREVNAIIKIDRTSEFVTFTATTENLTLSDYSLRYEFMLFKKDINNNVSKSLQGDRFFLKASEKKILSSVTVNNAVEGSVTLLLLVFPISDDEEQGAISKHRLVVTSSETGELLIEEDNLKKKQVTKISEDQDTSAKDGLFLNGLIIQKTLTKSGKDFYRFFYQDYYNKQIITNKNIFIEEVPGQRRSTRISVKVEDKLVWQFFARPKKDYLKKMASTSLDRCLRYLQQLQKQKETVKRY